MLFATLWAFSACTPAEHQFDGAGGSSSSTTSSSGGGATATSTGATMGCEDDAACDDDDACTADECNAGSCVSTPIDIDDQDACTQDTCDPESGVTHSPVELDDSDVCTVDACDPTTGVSHTAVAFDDGDACTDDGCDPVAGISHTPTNIDDGDACTDDSCDPALGVKHAPVKLDDGDVCTDDACDAVTGVSHTPIDIDDDNLCTDDSCDAILGVSHTVIDVDDGNVCTDDLCDPLAGITHPPTNIDDNDACTTDSCSPIGGIIHKSVAIDDNDACTTDACDPVAGVSHTPLTVSSLRISEMNVGTPDYIRIFNPTQCPLDVNGMGVLFDDSSAGDLNGVLGNFTLNPGASVYVTETNPPAAGELYAGGNIPYSATRGGVAYLCNGACVAGNGANVIDLVAFSTGAAHPALPAGLTFNPAGLTNGVDSVTQTVKSFLRAAYTGANPSFLASDWTSGVSTKNAYWTPGVQQNVSTATLAGWTQCFSETYSGATPLATVLATCDRANLLLACRPTGSATLTLAAMAPRADVLFDCGTAANCTKQSNGVGWYYDESWSWGFAPGGAPVNRNSCDFDSAAVISPELRMCWHTASSSLSSGYRCGTNISFDAAWERVLFHMY